MERHPLMDMDDASIATALAARLVEKKAAVSGVPLSKYSRVTGVVEKKDEESGETLGLVFGWAIVCTEKGKAYWDTQDDHIPEDSMLKASADFMENSRVLGDMHRTAEGGQVVFAFPLTAEIAKAYGWERPDVTGLMIAVRPANDETLAKFKSGEYSGFSIGGIRIDDEEVD
jgi:hypothetical protein